MNINFSIKISFFKPGKKIKDYEPSVPPYYD